MWRVVVLNPNQVYGSEKNWERRKLKSTKITDKTIEALKNKMNWEGNGSKLEPIVIEHLGDLPLIVKIYRNSLYYEIKNLTIDKLTCRNTQNITIENCTIKHLEIEGCYNMSLVNNKILKHKIRFTRGCTFSDNKISQIEKIKQYSFTTQGIPLKGNLSNLLTCCLYFVAFLILLTGTFFWFIGFILLLLLIFVNYSTYAKNKRTVDKPNNIYANNVEV